MPPADLLAWVRARPFQPFRIVMTEGVAYEVRHPELVVVALGSAVVGYPALEPAGAAARFDLVALRHIVRLELIDQPAPAGAGNGEA